MIIIIKFIFNINNFNIIVCFLTRLLTLGILFSIAVNAVFLAKLLISGINKKLTRPLVSGILFSNSVLSVLYLVLNTKSLVSILFTFSTNLLYTSFLTTSFFITSLNLLKSTGISINLWISNLSSSVFRLAKLVFSAKRELSTCEIFLISVFVAELL